MDSKKPFSRVAVTGFVVFLLCSALFAGCASSSDETANSESQQDQASTQDSAAEEGENIIEQVEKTVDEQQTAEEDEESSIEDTLKTEDLLPLEEAEEQTGILDADSGTLFASGEILITLSSGTKVDDINDQLKFCEFIEETRLDSDMLITGSIDHRKVIKGPSGEVIMMVHTAEGATIPQAIAMLQNSKILKKAEPNYIMQAL